MSPPRPFTEGKNKKKIRNRCFMTDRSFLPEIKTALLKLFFGGSPRRPAFLAVKEQDAEITGLGVEESFSHPCLGVPVCDCPPTPRRQIRSHASTLRVILSSGCNASVSSEVSGWLCPPMRDVDRSVLSFLPAADGTSESVPTKDSAKRRHTRKGDF